MGEITDFSGRLLHTMKTLNYAATAILVVLVFYLLNAGEGLLLPLVIAITLWYLINTLASAFARIRIGVFHFPKPICLMASLLSFILAIWGLINFLSSTFGDVLDVADQYQINLITRLQNFPLINLADFEGQTPTELLGSWINLPSFLASLASSFTGILTSGGIILIYTSFLFLEQGQLRSKIAALVGNPEEEENVQKILKRVRDDIQKYISIKFFTSSMTGILSYTFLRLVEVDFAGVWGLLIFLLNFIPTVGSIIATIFPAMIALAQSDGYSLFFLVLIGIGVLQICIGNILEPRLMGSSFNLSPIIILLNLGLWNYIWGIPGMFLCVPFLIIITIVLSHFPQTRRIAIMLSSDGRLRVPLDKTMGTFGIEPTKSLLPPDQAGNPDKD
jgi:predicted PurR-regulated permease PerM|tara:strand:- start:4406 stop:5575 length:1170 start_codon:yes stop_codon:yes gene_type:complete